MTFAGCVAALGWFAPGSALHAVDVTMPIPRSGMDLPPGEPGRPAGEMGEAAENLG